MQTIGEADSGRTLDLTVGEMVELRLAENPTTGFRWTVRSDGAPACEIVEDAFMPARSEPAPPGAGGVHVWRIKAAAVGSCGMDLSYGRSWQAAPDATRRFGLQVNVRG